MAHDCGRNAELGQWGADDELLLIQGPLCLNWRQRKFGVLPRIESAEISHDALPTAQRAALWERCAIGVHGAPGHFFIMVHTHGPGGAYIVQLFGGGTASLW